eukprot:7089665-Prymnesium_polylepis.1
MPSDNFTPQKAGKASNACEALCRWIHAIEVYDRAAKVDLAPKKEQIRAAEAEYETAMKGLNVKRAELKEMLDQLAPMETKLKQLTKVKAALEARYSHCEAKLVRAEKLMGGLGGERVQWSKISASLAMRYNNLLGDVLLSSGVIAYLGPFTINFRQQVIAQWLTLCEKKRIPASQNFDLQQIMGEP